MQDDNDYDVIIGGSGIAGSTTSMILAEHGYDVRMIEAETHPRFSIGEATFPQTAMWAWIIGEYFGIPEIRNLSDSEKIAEEITPTVGTKTSNGFLYHEEGQPISGDRIHQLVAPELPLYDEPHLHRASVDHYLVRSAVDYGVDYVDETPITDVDIDEDRVTVTTDHSTVTGDFYVDATGGGSVLAEQMGYWDDTPELETDSRAIFTHVEGLDPIDELIPDEEHPGQSKRLYCGTMHHLFDGGWMWNIPFDNIDHSESNKVSVGLVLDRAKYPIDESLSAEEEFYEVIGQFPDLERLMEPVEPVRPWVRTGRIQRTSSQSSGHRHFLTKTTYGFVDPLYSNGLLNTYMSVFVSSNLLLEAFEAGDLSAERFEPLEELHRQQIMESDFKISNAYRAMGDFETWNAWQQAWLGQVLFHDTYIFRYLFKYLGGADRSVFDPLIREGRPGSDAPFADDKAQLYETIDDALGAYSEGRRSSDEAAEAILEEMRGAEWLPKSVYDWGNRHERNIDVNDETVLHEYIEWGKEHSPARFQRELFDFPEVSPAVMEAA